MLEPERELDSQLPWDWKNRTFSKNTQNEVYFMKQWIIEKWQTKIRKKLKLTESTFTQSGDHWLST
jgi:hypothetical protein